MTARHRDDRHVVAYTRKWEIVRYERSGKYFAEYTGADRPPGWLGPALGMGVNSAGRVPLTLRRAVDVVEALSAVIQWGQPGCSAFERECSRRGLTP